MGKVAASAGAIMRTLWGTNGRPETNEYRDRCAWQQHALANQQQRSLVVTEEIKPRESRRTEAKWAKARARARGGRTS